MSKLQCNARRLKLTMRDQEVFNVLITGASVKECAAKLECSKWTVDEHIKALKTKTGAKNMVEVLAILTATPPLL